LNFRIGSSISVATKLLTVEDSKSLFEFRGCRRLLDPAAVPPFFICPANKVGRNDLRNAASDAASVLYVKIARY